MNLQTTKMNKIRKSKLQTLLGRIGTGPQIKYVKDGKLPICTFRFAVNKGKGNEPEWKSVVIFGDVAEITHAEAKKGDQLFIQGVDLESSYIDSYKKEKVRSEFRAYMVAPIIKTKESKGN